MLKKNGVALLVERLVARRTRIPATSHWLANMPKKGFKRLTRPEGVLVDDCDLSLLNSRTWHLDDGYLRTTIHEGGRTRRPRFHRMLMQPPPGFQVDHINGNRLDNRRCNLRVVTPKVNAQNIWRTKRNTSGYRGVSFDRRRNRWFAQCWSNGKNNWLGYHATLEDAADASHAFLLENVAGYVPQRLRAPI